MVVRVACRPAAAVLPAEHPPAAHPPAALEEAEAAARSDEQEADEQEAPEYRVDAEGQTVFPWYALPEDARPSALSMGFPEDDAPTEPPIELAEDEDAAIEPEDEPDPRQINLFAPSIMRRQTLRRRRSFRYVDIRGEVQSRHLLDEVPIVRPTSADDAGLPDWHRWTPPRHASAFDALPYLEDFDTRTFVREHPEGASLGEIAEHIGWSKQGVMEVERRAMRKLVALAMVDDEAAEWMATILGLELEEIAECLTKRDRAVADEIAAREHLRNLRRQRMTAAVKMPPTPRERPATIETSRPKRRAAADARVRLAS